MKKVHGVDDFIDDNKVQYNDTLEDYIMTKKMLNMSLVMKLVTMKGKIYLVIAMIQMTGCRNENVFFSCVINKMVVIFYPFVI